MPEALPEALALVLHPTPLPRDFSRRCAGRTDAEFAKLLRTFGCRHRHMSIGDFSAQCLNGRRQAMIFRLSGVALFRGSVRRVPAERKRQERPRQMIVVGRLRRFSDGCFDERRRRRRAHRQAQTSTLHIHCGPQSASHLKNGKSVRNCHAPKTVRSFSNCARIIERSASAFNGSWQVPTRGKVDRLG